MKQLCIVFSLLMFICTIVQADSELVQATKAAEEGFRLYLSESTTPRGIDDVSLKDARTVENATLGEAIEIMELRPAQIVNYNQGDGVSKLLKTSYSYYFPVLLYGKVRMLMSVHKYKKFNHKHYEIGSLSHVWLAKEFVKIKNQNPSIADKKMIFAECYEANSMVFSFPEIDDQNLQFIDFDDNDSERSPQYLKLSTADELVKIMDANIHEDIKKGVRK